MGWLDKLGQRMFGTGVNSSSRGLPSQDYARGGFGRRELLSPLPGGHVPSGGSSFEQDYFPRPAPTPPQPPTPTPPQMPERKDVWAFPAGDKPPIPEVYRGPISEAAGEGDIPHFSSILASLLAQESGGFGYTPYDWENKEILTSWDEAKKRRIIGPKGEVGLAQIIPKWYWKDAGFPDEESYTDALYDPFFSINETARVLRNKYQIYGDWKKALSKWNTAPSYPDEVLGRIGVPL